MHQRGVFIDAPDQAVADGNRFTGAKRHQSLTAAQGHAVLNERSVAVQANPVTVLQRLIRLPGHGLLHVLAQLSEDHDAVLEEVVIAHVRMIKRHHAVQIAVLPAQVVAHDRFASRLGLFRAVVGE